MTLIQYLEELGYLLVEPGYYRLIRNWRAWYKGKISSFHNYTILNSGKKLRRTRANLNMAKQGCETWANLLWNYECNVTADKDAAINKELEKTLRENDFWTQTNELTEKAFALGSGAYIAYPENGKVQIDYVTAEYIFPLTWRNGDVESCAFAADYTDGKQQLVYLMIHERQPDGSYRIQNKFFTRSRNSDQITPAPIPTGIQEEYTAKLKRFAILKPNIANNIADVPLGLSIYANWIDTLKNIDLAYDGIKVSMEIGRPRIGVTNTMMRVAMNGDNGLVEVFDTNDIAVYDMGTGADGQAVETKDLTVPYRAKDFEESLQTQLNIFSQNIGLGDKAFKWERGSVQTARQVISDDSAMLRTMEKHQEALRTAITDLARAVLDIRGMNTDTEITVVFDDSVTRDKEADRQRAWQWVVLGRFPFWKYLVEYEGYEAEDARALEAEAVGNMSETV